MRIIWRLFKGLVLLMVLGVVVLAGWLWLSPPDLIRVGAGYSAKIVCSNVFIAGRDPDEVLEVDVQAPGHPLLRLMSVSVDRDAGTVSAGLLGVFGRQVAIHREGAGCAAAPEGEAAPLAVSPAHDELADWPAGEPTDPAERAAVEAILADPEMTGPGMRGIVVVHHGAVVGERYGDGFDAGTPLLGWSMTKTVTAAIIGTLVADGRLTLDAKGLLPDWQDDERGEIKLSDMLAMSSGLAFNEEYGDVTDVTRMLYLETDMAGFAASKPLAGPIGETWSYSSGTTVMLSRIWQNAAGAEAADLPRENLFGPLGMTSAVLEADAAGTFVGSSYLYATARDWARFGLFLARDGVWDERRILPEGYVAFMRDPAPASGGEYGRGQTWLHGPTAGTLPGLDPDEGFALPDDVFWLLGHDGQSMVVMPTLDLVIVRLGLTPSSLGYKPQKMAAAIVAAVD